MIDVRWATEEDAAAIVRLLIDEMYPEVGVHLADQVNFSKVAGTVLDSISGEGSIAAFERDRCVGVLNLIRTRWWFSDQEFIADQGFFVTPEHRGKIGTKLVEHAKIHAERVGLSCFIFRFNPSRAKGRVADRLEVASVVGQAIKM